MVLVIGLFSFDGPMYKDRDGTYCNTTITDQMFERYFSVVDELIVIIRTYTIQQSYSEAGLHKVNMNNCIVVELPNFNSLKGYIVDKPHFTAVINDYVQQADLIFARIPSVTSNIVVDAARRQNKKYLVEVGGCAWDSYWNHSLVGKFIAPIMYAKEKRAVKGASFATYVTSQWLQNRYPTNGISVAASNVYIDNYSDDVIANRLRKFNNLSKTFVLGTAAAVDVKYKGQGDVIKALSVLIHEGYDIRYETIGVGSFEYLSNIARKCNIEDRVAHKGLLVKKEVYEWLDRIDIYIQPSKQEGLPRALIEAMSRGVPSIGSDVAGIPELLPVETIFKKGNVDDLCRVLRAIIGMDMKKYVTLNYEESKKYNLEKLEKVRKHIFSLYFQQVVGGDGVSVESQESIE